MVRRILDFQQAALKTSQQVPSPEQLKQDTHVTVRLSEVLPALTDALMSHRAWVQDFEDDLLQVSKDLLEVIQAYDRMRSAA